MGNIGGGEILVILLLGIVVLGPGKLAVVARQIGRVIREVRRVATGFQEEFRDLVEDPSLETMARERGQRLTGSVSPESATDEAEEAGG